MSRSLSEIARDHARHWGGRLQGVEGEGRLTKECPLMVVPALEIDSTRRLLVKLAEVVEEAERPAVDGDELTGWLKETFRVEHGELVLAKTPCPFILNREQGESLLAHLHSILDGLPTLDERLGISRDIKS